ncbi:MAG: hypothetical protein HOV80_14410 [Polyangiaceae bacterium]|nr:hypothetical protein [Polyangiaceae bacterium]
MAGSVARCIGVLATAASFFVAARPASAQDAPAADPPAAEGAGAAVAERLFREGRSLIESGQTEAACKKFAESQRLDPQLGTLLNLAECEAQIGRTATAWARFRELAEKARRAEQADRQAYAEKQVAALEAKLTYAVLRLPPGSEDIRIDVDGQPLGAASYSTALPLDPGRHRLDISRGVEKFIVEFDLEARPGQQSIDVALDDAHRVGGNPPAPPPPKEDGGVDGRVVAGWVLIAAAAVGAGVGTYFGVSAMSLKDDADARCDGRFCDALGLEAFEDARTNAHGATVSFAIGGAAAIAGTSLLVWAAIDGPPAASVSLAGRF